MKIPSILHGRPRAVLSRCRKLAKQIVSAGTFDAFDPGPYMDTSTAPGILFTEADSLWGNGENFQCWALTFAVEELAPEGEGYFPFQGSWLRSSLNEPWRYLGAMEGTLTPVLGKDRSLLRPFAEAGVRYWPILSGEGSRFGPYGDAPEGAWSVLRVLKYALANLGAPPEMLYAAPKGGPGAVLDWIDKGQVRG
jgi:hypothetical protein